MLLCLPAPHLIHRSASGRLCTCKPDRHQGLFTHLMRPLLRGCMLPATKAQYILRTYSSGDIPCCCCCCLCFRCGCSRLLAAGRSSSSSSPSASSPSAASPSSSASCSPSSTSASACQVAAHHSGHAGRTQCPVARVGDPCLAMSHNTPNRHETIDITSLALEDELCSAP